MLLDGKVVAAVEEERFNRVKHWAGVPTKSVAYCLAEVGARLSDVDHFAVSFSPRANLLRRAAFALRRPLACGVLDRLVAAVQLSVGQFLGRLGQRRQLG